MPGHLLSAKPWMSQAADSAGNPFDGREFRDHPFAGDDGSCPVELGQAIGGYRRALAHEDDRELALAGIRLVDALRSNRVLVPLIAEAGDLGATPEGRVVDKTQELSIVTVEGHLGQPVGVVFSAVDQMTSWRVDARPIPVDASRVAAWALTEDASQVVLDAGSDTPIVCRRGMLWALVSDDVYLPAWEDPAVREVIEARDLWGEVVGLHSIGVLSGWRLDGGAGPDIIARIELTPGLDRTEVDAVTTRLARQWATNPEPLGLVDGIRVELVAADSEKPTE